jgi:hypothetical protein
MIAKEIILKINTLVVFSLQKPLQFLQADYDACKGNNEKINQNVLTIVQNKISVILKSDKSAVQAFTHLQKMGFIWS